MESGKLPNSGLCLCLPKKSKIDLFYPTIQDMLKLRKEDCSTVFWAHGVPGITKTDSRAYTFTPIRQTIVLFLAAMNNEL